MDDRERDSIRARIPHDRQFLIGWKELEAWAGISTQTLRKFKEVGLPGNCFEGTICFSKGAVNKFFERQTQQPLIRVEKEVKK